MKRKVTTELPYDLTRLARWCAGLLTVIIALEVLLWLLFAWNLADVNRALEGQDVETIDFLDQSYVRSGLAVQGVVSIYFLANLTALVSNGIWIYRASANAAAIEPSEERIKPGWAVGWFFVPFANLWVPYRAMRQTWNSSMNTAGGMDAGLPGWIALWWGAYILSYILGFISAKMLWDSVDLEVYAVVNWIDIVSAALGVLAAWYFRRIILEVSAAQGLSQRRMEEVFA